MQVSVETTSGLGRRMTVQIPADQMDQQVNSKLQQLVSSVRLDGFRPGKVPLSVVKKRYETKVREETAAELIASTYEQALEQENLKPAGEPNIEQTRNRSGEELEYVAMFDVYPEIEVPDLGEIKLERPLAEVADTEIDQMLDKLRRQRMTWSTVDRAAADGDRIEIDFEGTVDGQAFSGNAAKNIPLELGSGSMIPGFEDQLLGVNAGDSKTIDVTFPDNYTSTEVAGKAAKFDITVHGVSESTLPELDDEFARAFGVGDGGLEALRGEVSKNMRRELDAAIKARIKSQVFDALLDKAGLDVPASLLDSEIDALIKKEADGADAGGDRSRYEDEARRRVSLGLLISEIIQRNQLAVDPDRVRETIEQLAQSYENPEEVVQWYYSNQEMLAGVQTLIMEETVVDWVVEQAQVEDKSTTFEEIMQAASSAA
ncbi:Cell division trigger factor [hydrothermal vent metagenome]|uniref:peptidylprolyl isomerase n=1 Tax=hydrothermal vent metagenome TaxID=652676 RepID=A0A3B0YQM2_9ZZZZ